MEKLRFERLHQVNIRLDDEVCAWVLRQAAADRLTPSGFVRRMVEAAAKIDLVQDQKEERRRSR